GRAQSRRDPVHRPRRRSSGGGRRARLQAGGRALRRRHHPARRAAKAFARADVPGDHGLHGDSPRAADQAVRRQARAPGTALRHRLQRDPPARAQGLGQAGEHHHVSPVHPEYAKLPALQRDVAKAKKLLADAGYPNGIDTEIIARPQPGWELLAVQAMVEQWKEAGIRVKINVMPSTQYWEVWTKVPFGFTTWAHRPLGVMS